MIKFDNRLTPKQWPHSPEALFPGVVWPLRRLQSHPFYQYWRDHCEGVQRQAKDPPFELWYAMNTILEPKNLDAWCDGGTMVDFRASFEQRALLLADALVRCNVFKSELVDFETRLLPATQQIHKTSSARSPGRPRSAVQKVILSVSMDLDVADLCRDYSETNHISMSRFITETMRAKLESS